MLRSQKSTGSGGERNRIGAAIPPKTDLARVIRANSPDQTQILGKRCGYND